MYEPIEKIGTIDKQPVMLEYDGNLRNGKPYRVELHRNGHYFDTKEQAREYFHDYKRDYEKLKRKYSRFC